jgi:hypothetical protein
LSFRGGFRVFLGDVFVSRVAFFCVFGVVFVCFQGCFRMFHGFFCVSAVVLCFCGDYLCFPLLSCVSVVILCVFWVVFEL